MEIKKFDLKGLVEKVGMGRMLLLVAAGVVLLLFSIPTGGGGEEKGEGEVSTEQEQQEVAWDAMEEYARNQEKTTEQILEKVAGIGKVKVKLTLKASEEKIPLQNHDTSEDISKEEDKAGGTRNSTNFNTSQESVLIQKDNEDVPYVVQINSPQIEGVIVVAQGADSARIQSEIIGAIQALFPVEVHKIKVMKME